MPKYGLVSLGLIIVFLATAHIFSYKEAVANGYKDVETYYFMAGNGFDESSSKKYLSHHLERWPLQLLVGYLSKGLNIDIWTMYRVLVLVLIAITYYVIRSLNCPVNNKMAIFSLILFNPYTFRSFYAVPGMISDCTLYVGLLFVVCGIINKVGFQVFLGVFLSVISRQTSILLIPIFITLYYFKYLTLRNLIIYCFVIIIGFIGIKHLTVQFYGVSDSAYFIKHAFGIFSWIFNSFSINEAISFFGRYLLFLLTLSGIILLIDGNYKNSWIFIAIFIFIHLQPLAGGPLITAGNIQRLSALGLPFLIPLIFTSIVSEKSIIYFIIITIIVSLHHQHTFIYHINNGNILFFLLILSSLPVSLYLKYSLRKIKG